MDPQQGYYHAKLETYSLNSVHQKANKEIRKREFFPLNMCKSGK